MTQHQDRKDGLAPCEANTSSRRAFLASAGAATTAAALAAPAVVRAQAPIRLRFQSTWANRDIFHEFAGDYVKRVNDMSGKRIEIQLLEAGSVVPAFQMMDAINSGILDGGHGVAAYWYGKNKAFSLFGTAPAFGWNAQQLLGWIHYGGGQQFYDELVTDILKLDVVGFLTGPMPSQPLGWFTKDITSAEDLKAIKYRTVGLAADLFSEMGSAVTILPGNDIVPAIDRGLIDGAEFNNPSSDRALGFADVAKIYIVGSYHQALECFEILFNKGRYESLPAEARAILKYGAEAASADMSWKLQDRYEKDLQALRTKGVKISRTPISVLEAQLAAWDVVIANGSKDPFFKKVVDSQKEWARRTVTFSRDYDAPVDLAYQHFFGTA